MTDTRAPLADAVARLVEPGDTIHVIGGHARWTAAARELCRQWWGRDPGFTLVMASLTTLGTLFFRGGLVRKVVTGYSGDTFPTFTPNPVFAGAYRAGAVEVEHWSFLAYVARLRAAALGLPAMVTRSVVGSSMEANAGFVTLPDPFGGGEPLGLVAPLRPDVALLHAPLADAAGHVVLPPPLLEGVWGAWAARKGTIVTVERVVDDVRPWADHVRLLPRHVAAVCEAPMGAHPGGLYAPGLPVQPYGEDIPFWCEARDATRLPADELDAWIRARLLDPPDQAAYLAGLGEERLAGLVARADRDSWRADAAAHPVDTAATTTAWETAAVLGARHLADRVLATGTDAVLAGAGVANLAAWLGVELARERGAEVRLTAELGLWGYEPTPADPYIFNHRSFPSATMLADAETVLGGVIGGCGGRSMACLGAAQIDRHGNINSTDIPGGPFLVGSGGGNDVASTVAEAVVVATADRRRLVGELGYITSPGRAVAALATDVGIFERRGGQLVLTGVVAGVRADDVRARCGWDLEVTRNLAELDPPTPAEVLALRRWDPTGLFLGV